MHFHGCEVRLSRVRLHHVSLSTLYALHGVIGPRNVTATARAIAPIGTVTIIAGIARLMWRLPATLDALIAVAAAIAWTSSLDRQVQR
jgi:hypothetical protein